MWRFVKQIFVSAMMSFSCNLSNVSPLKCVSMKNQEYKMRPGIVNVNSDEPTFYPSSVKKLINLVVVVIISMIRMLK